MQSKGGIPRLRSERHCKRRGVPRLRSERHCKRRGVPRLCPPAADFARKDTSWALGGKRCGILAGVAVYHVYILASPSAVLYTGVTNHLERRVSQHPEELIPGFTKKYNVTRLVDFQALRGLGAAILRGK